MKKKLFLDFDGVIVNTVKAIVELYNNDFQFYKNYRPVHWKEINTWDFIECNCADTDYINKYFNQPRFFDRLAFMPDAYRVILELEKLYDITIVSMGYSPNLRGKELWMKECLPEIDFIGVNMKEHINKSHIDMSDGIFIDDSYSNLISSNAEKKYCFGEIYSWNEKWEGPRLCDWRDVASHLIN